MATTALVALQDLACEFLPYWRPTKYKTDIEAARVAAWSYVEGWERAINETFGRIFPANGLSGAQWRGISALLEACPPTYAYVRGWLFGECNFSYTVACRVALETTTANDRILRRRLS